MARVREFRVPEHTTKIRQALRDQKLVIIAGAGVSQNAIQPSPQYLSWTGLIQNGLDYLQKRRYIATDDKELEHNRAVLQGGDATPRQLLRACRYLKEELDLNRQFPTWLDSVFCNLHNAVNHPEVFEVISTFHQRGARLMTTNFDELLEHFCRLQRVRRSIPEDVRKYEQNKLNGVFHIHGSFQDPDEVVLDHISYDDVKNSGDVQSLLKTYLGHNTILFMGCDSGLEDPNFNALLKWASAREEKVPNHHYILARDGDSINFSPLITLNYGPSYENLAPYLSELLDEPASALTETNLRKTGICVPWLVPFTRDLSFVGRKNQLKKLIDRLSSENFQRHAIWGVRGSGKTALALEFAHCTRQQDPDRAVFWASATSRDSFERSYRDIGEALSIPGIADEGVDFMRLVKAKLSDCFSGRWMIILDNADDVDILFDNRGQDHTDCLIDYLPHSRQGFLVFTTGTKSSAISLAASNVIELNELQKSEAMEIMEKQLLRKDRLHDGEVVDGFLKTLAYQPLALVQAIAFINQNDVTIPKYMVLYKDAEKNSLNLGQGREDWSEYLEKKSPVATTWDISFRLIRRIHPLVAECIFLMAFMTGECIPVSLLLPTADEAARNKAIGTLRSYALILERQPQRSGPLEHRQELAIDPHRLVHLATGTWLRVHGAWPIWMGKALTRLKDMAPCGALQAKRTWRTYLPQAIHAAALPGVSEAKIRLSLLERIGLCQRTIGHYKSAERSYRELKWLRKRTLGNEHPLTLRSVSNLAQVMVEQGEFAEAERYHRYELALSETLWGKEHPTTLVIMNDIGVALWEQGEYDKAAKMHRDTLALNKKVRGNEHPETLTSMNNLAQALYDLEEYAEVESIYREELAMGEKISKKRSPNMLLSMNNLGMALCEQGKYSEAEKLLRLTLTYSSKVLGRKNPTTLTSMINLVQAMRGQRKFAEAEQMYREAVQKEVLRDEHPTAMSGMGSLGCI